MKERAIEQDKLRSIEKVDPVKEQVVVEDEVVVKKPTRMSFILPALQNHGFSDEDSDDNESLKDPNEKEEEKLEKQVVEETKKLDIVDEIEALEISSAPVMTPPAVKTPTTEKPATYEPIPFERPCKPPVPTTQTIDPEIETPTVTPSEPIITEKAAVIEKEEKKATMEDIQKEVEMAAVAVAAVTATAATVEILTSPENQVTQEEHKEDFKSMVEHATDLNSPTTTTTDDSGISVSKISQDDDRARNHLAAILPAVEEAVRDVTEKQSQVPQPSKMEHQILPEDRERANRSREFEYSIEDPIDLDMFRDNVIAIQAIDPKDIPINTFKPREQEVAGKVIFVCVCASVFSSIKF